MKDRKTNKESFTKKAGDKMEHTGEKLKKSGHDKIGNTIYNAGNKLEHFGDRKSKR